MGNVKDSKEHGVDANNFEITYDVQRKDEEDVTSNLLQEDVVHMAEQKKFQATRKQWQPIDFDIVTDSHLLPISLKIFQFDRVGINFYIILKEFSKGFKNTPF